MVVAGAQGKRERLRDYLLDAIRTGRLVAGNPIPSRAELMNTFACARATVDQVINLLLDEGVLSSMKGKGTFVAAPRSLPSVDALAVVSFSNRFEWHSEIEQGLLESIPQGVRLARFTYEELKLPSVWEACRAHRAMVFVMPDAEQEPFLAQARQQNAPHLVAYRDPPESAFVCVDVRSSMRSLVSLMHKKGASRFAWFGGMHSRYHFPERRYAGFLEGLLESNLPLNRHWTQFASGDDEGTLAPLFNQKGRLRPDAIILSQKPIKPLLSILEKCRLVPGKDVLIGTTEEVPAGTYPFKTFSLARLTYETGQTAGKLITKIKGSSIKPSMQQYLEPVILER